MNHELGRLYEPGVLRDAEPDQSPRGWPQQVDRPYTVASI